MREGRILGIFPYKTLMGCADGRHGGVHNAYLTRVTLAKLGRYGEVCVHYFWRSDADTEYHDHPWNFITLILWGGYVEHTPNNPPVKFRPFSGAYRPANWQHRVSLLRRRCITLIWRSPKLREWGFTTDGRDWIPFEKFHKDRGC